jgi:hypothetical protein
VPETSTLRRFVPRPLRPAARRSRRALGDARRRRDVLRRYDATLLNPWAFHYLVLGRELDNFTYDVANVDELADFLAAALGCPAERVLAYVHELEDDDGFRRDLTDRLGARRRGHAHYGRRAGWYAAARIAKPRVAVETGIHDGLGSAVLLRALQRNSGESAPGRLIAFDVADGVGWLVPDELRGAYEPVIGDTRDALAPGLAGRRVDFFVHDSLHTYEHETFELETVLPLAAPGALLLSDNAHAQPAFADFCERHGLPCHVFRERPKRHFYPGAGIGLTVVPPA